MNKTEKIIHGVYFPTPEAMIDKTNSNKEAAVQSELLEIREQMEKSKDFFIKTHFLSGAAIDALTMLGYEVSRITDQTDYTLSYEISWKPTPKEIAK